MHGNAIQVLTPSIEEEGNKQATAILSHFSKENPDSKHVPKVTAHYADVSSESSVATCIDSILAAHSNKIDHFSLLVM